jgi:hypothetical protein
MRFAMEFFIPYLLTSNPILDNITRCNSLVLTKDQVPLEISEKKNLTSIKWLNLKIKLDYSKPTYMA